MRKPQISLAME